MLQNLEWNGVLKRLIQDTTLQDCNTSKFKLLSRFVLTLGFEGSVQSDFITVEECGRPAGSLGHFILSGHLKLQLEISDRGLEGTFETADDLQEGINLVSCCYGVVPVLAK